jgi:thymidylate kinase
MKGINVKLIHESVRENCPFPINADANQGTCLWNFHKQFLNELDAEAQGYELSICDRSVLDTFVYFHAVNPNNPVTISAELQASQWLSTYNILIVLEPATSVELLGDGIRETDLEYQKLITNGFREVLQKYGESIKERIIFISSEDIFEETLQHKLVETIESKISLGLEV